MNTDQPFPAYEKWPHILISAVPSAIALLTLRKPVPVSSFPALPSDLSEYQEQLPADFRYILEVHADNQGTHNTDQFRVPEMALEIRRWVRNNHSWYWATYDTTNWFADVAAIPYDDVRAFG
ncbi:hypothetical protein SDC9_152677 [bioreactor metagenome]|uniref:Uncharacterized protein n=1 Tax=bioreactor metagenome TaxID=1076179 RepID=A0A645EUA0_9ZZZZ